MIIKCEAQIIESTPEVTSEIESKFSKEDLFLIDKEISIIKKETFLHDQVRVGGDILGEIFGVEDFQKVLLLSQYIDEIVSRLQSRI